VNCETDHETIGILCFSDCVYAELNGKSPMRAILSISTTDFFKYR